MSVPSASHSSKSHLLNSATCSDSDLEGRATEVSELLFVPHRMLIFNRHLKPKYISYCEYYGPERTKLFGLLGSYDLVITTFSVVRQDWKSHSSETKGKSTVHDLEWHRIILDEGAFSYIHTSQATSLTSQLTSSESLRVCSLLRFAP